jgi:hypothetical protein
MVGGDGGEDEAVAEGGGEGRAEGAEDQTYWNL